MTEASRPSAPGPPSPPLTLPGGRTLLGWWRELAGVQPQRLWFAHLLLHRVEALVEVSAGHPLDPLPHALLRTLALPAAQGRPLPDVHLDPQLRGQLLRDLCAAGLVSPGAAEGAWEVTEAGRRALCPAPGAGEGKALGPGERQRRVFPFVEDWPGPPRYLPLTGGSTPLSPPEGWHFDPAVLSACVAETAAWKARHRFPTEIREVILPGHADGGSSNGEVIFDRAEQVLLALVQVPPARPGAPEFLGFSVRAEGWVLSREAPVLALAGDGAQVVPGLAEEPTAEEWRQAWLAWCQPRALPPGEVEACRLEPSESRLVVRAPASLIERLRLARSDALKGEAWLLAGPATSRTRAAALIELVEG